MNNEVRKPREVKSVISGNVEKFIVQPGAGHLPDGEYIFKEILPGDDSLRVSREDWDILKIQCAMNSGSGWDLMERIEREQETK